MSRPSRSEPVRCLPAPRREPAFRDPGTQSAEIPQPMKTAQKRRFHREKGGMSEKSGTPGRTFSDDTRSSGDGATQGSAIRLASRQAREKQETAGRDRRSVLVARWESPPPRRWLRFERVAAHAMGIAPRAATTLPADLIWLSRISSNRATVSLPAPVGITAPRASFPSQVPRSVTVRPPTKRSSAVFPHPPTSSFPIQEKAP